MACVRCSAAGNTNTRHVWTALATHRLVTLPFQVRVALALTQARQIIPQHDIWVDGGEGEAQTRGLSARGHKTNTFEAP